MHEGNIGSAKVDVCQEENTGDLWKNIIPMIMTPYFYVHTPTALPSGMGLRRRGCSDGE
jgi:hypothetical protein